MDKRISDRGFNQILEETRKKSPNFTKAATSHGLKSLAEKAEAASIVLDATTPSVYSDLTLQREIRTSFGKPGTNNSPIGSHPDFAYLAGTDLHESHYICSLFLDIKNSTRLSFLYDLEDVVFIKNSILRAAAETVRALDGYVHRFMGDALLAFFGDRKRTEEDSIANAINCASVLEALMTGTIIPALGERGYDVKDIGFRIGLDFGKKEKVLWSSYGFNGVSEITATSFHVDVAAKLQSMARKNTAMIGEQMISTLDLPEVFLKRKTIVKDGIRTEIEHLDKTYRDKDGLDHKYKVRELYNAKYRDLLPFPAALKCEFEGSNTEFADGFEYKCYVVGDQGMVEYRSISRVLPKRASLKFSLFINREACLKYNFPLQVRFIKINHGTEAQLKEQKGVFPKSPQIVSRPQGTESSFFSAPRIDIEESTLYRGLHTMEVDVSDSRGNRLFRETIGVFIV